MIISDALTYNLILMSEGIILPPFELRRLIDKAAEFVAKNGANFETMLIKAEINNPKFSFFSTDDIYHAYYRQKLQELTPKSNAIISCRAGRPERNATSKRANQAAASRPVHC